MSAAFKLLVSLSTMVDRKLWISWPQISEVLYILVSSFDLPRKVFLEGNGFTRCFTLHRLKLSCTCQKNTLLTFPSAVLRKQTTTLGCFKIFQSSNFTNKYITCLVGKYTINDVTNVLLTYVWPVSCAIINADVNPSSSFRVQLRMR